MPDITAIPAIIILLHPLGLSLFIGLLSMLVFLIIIFAKTPAWSFFWASLRKRMLIINPREDKILKFQTGKKEGSMVHVKNQGYYLIDPNDIYMESGSKLPASIAFGNFAIPINLKMAKIAERLQMMGIKNWEYLMEYVKLIQEQIAKNPNPNPVDANPVINILGESVPIATAIDYFNRNERSDFIESEIQRRTATELMKKVGAGANMLKWIIGVGILILLVFVGYAIFSTALAGTQSIPIPELKELLATPRVVTESTGTALE